MKTTIDKVVEMISTVLSGGELQVHDLKDEVLNFYDDEEIKREYIEWHIKKYGSKPTGQFLN